MHLEGGKEFFEEYWPWILGVSIVLILIIGILYLRRKIQGVSCTSTARLDGKTVIITGSNSGIGKETARNFYGRGARVILACRSENRAAEAAQDIESFPNSDGPVGTVVIRILDLCDFNSICAFALDILRTESRIDILINNAGVVVPKQTTVDGFDMIFQANHLGHFLLTNLLLEKIKASAPARIINVSSDLHKWAEMDWEDLNLNAEGAYGPWKAYGKSKLANILFTKELAKRLQGSVVNVYALHPGAVHSGFQSTASDVFPKVVYRWYVTVSRLFFKNVVQGSQTTIHCALCEKSAHETGLYYDECRPKTPSKNARDVASIKLLWPVSAEMVKLDERLATLTTKLNSEAVLSHL